MLMPLSDDRMIGKRPGWTGRNLLKRSIFDLAMVVVNLLFGGAGWAALEPDPLTPEERAWLRQHEPLRYAPHLYSPPLEFRGASNSLGGMVPELLALVATNLDLRIEHVFVSDSPLEAIARGRADFAGAWAETRERAERFRFSRPYLWMSNVFFVRKDAPFQAVQNLTQRKVAVVQGISAHEWLKTQNGRYQVVPVSSIREGLLLVSVGQLDAMLETQSAGRRIGRESGIVNLRYLPESPFASPQQLVVAKENERLLAILQKGLDSVPVAQRERIIAKWRRVDSPAVFPALPKWIWQIAGIVAVAVFGMVLWIVTLRRQVERRTSELQASETHFRLFYENAPVAYHSLDDQGRILEVNDSWLEMFGYVNTEVIGRSLTDFLESSQTALWREHFQRFLATGRTSGAEFTFRVKQGQPIVVLVEGRLGAKCQDNAIRTHCVLHNITERKRVETEVQQSRALLHSIIEGTDEAIFAKDRNGRYLLFNGAAVRMTGKPAAAILGQDDRLLFPEEEVKVVLANDQRIMERGEVKTLDEVVTLADGQKHSLLVTKGPLRDSQGQVTGLFGISRDVSDRVRVMQALRQSEARLAAAQRIARLGSWEAGLENLTHLAANPLWWSDEVFRIFGYVPGQIEVTNALFFQAVHPDDRARLLAHIETALRQRAPFEVEHRIILPDGSERFVHEQAELILDPDSGRPLKFSGTVQDVTERRRAEEEIRSLNARLESRLIALTQPLGDQANVRFEDLFDLAEIQRIQDAFAAATGVASIITDPAGRPLTRPSRFCRLCEHIIRKTEKGLENCIHSDAVLGRQHEGGPIIQRCLSGGLWDAGTSICVGDRHVANWLIGQVLEDPADEAAMLAYAREIGADAAEFGRALQEVTRMSRAQFEKICVALHLIAGQLSRQAAQNVQQARFIPERKRAQAALEEKERFISAVAGNTPDYIVVFDLEQQRQVYRNKVLPNLLGYTSEEAEQIAAETLLSLMHPEDWPRFQAHLDRLAHAADHSVLSLEYRMRRRDGSHAWFLARDTVFLRDGEGRPRQILSVAQDISERKAGEETRAHLEAQLRQAQKMEAVGQLAGGVAHDFNNILAALLMNLNLLQDEPGASSECREGLAEMESLVHRATTLTRQLLLFGRRQVMQRRPLDLNLLLANLLKMLGRLIGEHIRLDFQAAPQALWIEADAGMVEQVIINLVVNARDAMPQGGLIHLRTQAVILASAAAASHPQARPGSFISLSVCDSGSGMDSVTLRRIFEPFFTTKGVGKGTGLGLSTAYSIVDQHQGWIEVESTVGQGSSFHVFWPACPSPSSHPLLEPSQAPVSRGCETILVVEDEKAVRQVTVRTLNHYGYRVIEADHGRDALHRWPEHAAGVDLLLTDVVMPEGLSGFELVERLRQTRPGLPAILMSGYNSEMMIRHLTLPSGTVFLQKPFVPADLARKIRELLDGPAKTSVT